METNIVRKYDYTLENGVVTKMVVNSSSKMTIGDNTKEVQAHGDSPVIQRKRSIPNGVIL